MSTTKASLTVTFEAPFWIGLYERESDGAYEVCKITFGAEPKDYEVHEFLLRNWHGLSFSPKAPRRHAFRAATESEAAAKGNQTSA